LNISTRLRVGTDDNVLIGGFIISGNNPKRVVLRAIGPSLRNNDEPIAGRLEDPILELYDASGEIIGSNDNWKDSQRAELEASGLAPSDDRESAIVRVLTPGAYTAIVRGKDNSTGIALVEAYDVATAARSRLANISTRGFVETADNVIIGGFIAGNESGATKVVLRAIGPSLGSKGVPNPLQDPLLELNDENGNAIASNNDWQDDPFASEIQARELAPSDERESATFQTLAPAAYTVIVRGVDNTPGVGLVEVYETN